MNKFITIVKRETLRQMKSWKIITIAAVMLAIMLITIPVTLFATQNIISGYTILSVPYNSNGTVNLKVIAIDTSGNPVTVTGNVSYRYANNASIFISNFKTITTGPITIKTNIPFNYSSGQPAGLFIFNTAGGHIVPSTFVDVSDALMVSFAEIFSPSNSSMPGVAILASCFNGTVPKGLSVYINESFAGNPDNNGFLKVYGTGPVKIRYMNSSNTLVKLVPQNLPISISVKTLIISLSSSLISFFVPIAAIIAGYDALAKEKVSGALDIIISRPLKKETVYWGKILGSFISIFTYFLIISILFPIFAMFYGIYVNIYEIGSILISVSFLAFVFIIIEGISGFFGKSVSTPLIWGIVIWIFFNMIFSAISLIIIFASGMNLVSMNAIKLSNMINLANPIDVAKYITYLSLPNPQFIAYGISLPEVVVSSIAWTLFSIGLFIYFTKKYE